MYTEEYENKGFPFRNFLLKLILIIIFVFLLVWLLPKFIAPAVTRSLKGDNGTVEITDQDSQLSALTSQIFAENLERMKNAAIVYYTTDRLPKNVGDSKKMTLREMISQKLISPLVDKNNKPVDVDASYVQITKTNDGYTLKVNIKDSEKEDYILVQLGCYSYCENDICVKDSNFKETRTTQTVVVKPTPEKPSTVTPTKPDPTPVDPTPVDPTPVDPTPVDPTPVDPSDPDPEDDNPGTDKIIYEYEYKKTTGAKLSDWSKWSDFAKTSCKTTSIKCTASDIDCLTERMLYNRKEKIGEYDAKYVKKRQVQYIASSYEAETCVGYHYIIVNSTTYAITTTVATYHGSSGGGWSSGPTSLYSNPPADTATTHYTFVGADFSGCSDSCSSLPDFYYQESHYTGDATSTSSTTVAPVSSSTTVTAKCNKTEKKTVYVYRTKEVSEVATRKEPLYGTVCYASTRTRTVVSTGTTQTKWSTYDDKTLLNAGWYYTGQKRPKN